MRVSPAANNGRRRPDLHANNRKSRALAVAAAPAFA
jgi:hypothetical protein